MKRQSFALRVGLLVPVLIGPLFWAGCSDAIGPRWVQTIKIVPSGVHLEPGETNVFGVEILDQNGEAFSDDWLQRVKWSNVTPSLLTVEMMDVGVLVTALKPGIAAVRAELGRGRSTGQVYIQPPGLDRIEIDPSPFTLSLVTGSVRAYARLFDSSGAEMSTDGFRILWRTADTTIATIPNAENSIEFAIVRPRREGQTRLRLTVGDTTVSTDLFVIGEPLPPSAPIVNTVSTSSLEVVWARVRGANQGYRIFRSTSVGGAFSHVGSTGSENETSYVDTGLSPGTTYFYQIEACHPAEGCSQRSPPGSGTTAGGG